MRAIVLGDVSSDGGSQGGLATLLGSRVDNGSETMPKDVVEDSLLPTGEANQRGWRLDCDSISILVYRFLGSGDRIKVGLDPVTDVRRRLGSGLLLQSPLEYYIGDGPGR